MLVSVSELTVMKYYELGLDRKISGTTIYANNYEYSYVRADLNGLVRYGENGTTTGVSKIDDRYLGKGLLQKAFTGAQSNLIQVTAVDNSAITTGSSSNSYYCDNTNDKIFLLSYQELTNTNYFSDDKARIKYPTDYARAIGAYSNTPGGVRGYLARSPNADSATNALFVDGDGRMYYSFVHSSGYVVPALFLSI